MKRIKNPLKLNVVLRYNPKVDPDGFSSVCLKGLTMEQLVSLVDIVHRQDDEDIELWVKYQEE